MKLMDVLCLVIGRQALWRLGRRLYMEGRGETANGMEVNGERALLEAFLNTLDMQPHKIGGITVFDVGANVGDWSNMVMQAADSRDIEVKIHGFEPAPSTFDHLEARFASCRQFTGRQLALSSESGTTSFHIVGPGAGTNSFYASGDAHDTVVVLTETGAKYAELENLELIHFVKIDAEGHDLEVIRGFESLLRKREILLLQFEYNHRWLYSSSSLFQIFNMVKNLDYKVAKIRPDRLEVLTHWNPELDRYFEGNYALVRNDILPTLPHIIGEFGPSNTWVPKPRTSGA